MVIEDDYKVSFAKASEAIEMVCAEIAKTSKVPPMYGHCTSFGKLLAACAKEQDFNSDVAAAYMMTSDNPNLVKRLHAFAEKNNNEMAKWDEKKSAEAAKPGK